MKKKWILGSVLAVVCLLTISWFSSSAESTEAPCAFCDETILQAQTIYEDELVLALATHKPIFPGHCLIIPKRHVERFEGLSEEEVARMMSVVNRVHQAVSSELNTTAYLLLQKNGIEVGQTVPHVHFHYIPREGGDGSVMEFALRMLWTNWKAPLAPEEMQELVQRLQNAMHPEKS
jgi:histidine triad (HIT) family protein